MLRGRIARTHAGDDSGGMGIGRCAGQPRARAPPRARARGRSTRRRPIRVRSTTATGTSSRPSRHGDRSGARRILDVDLGRGQRHYGYPYPPFDVTPDVDGRRMELEDRQVHRRPREGHALVRPGKGRVNTNGSPINQQLTGRPSRRSTGPFVVDLHKGGPLDGKGGGGEQALAVRGHHEPELERRRAFDPTTTTRSASAPFRRASDGSAINVNLDQTEEADYQYMVKGDAEGHPYSVYYYGTATWTGDAVRRRPPASPQCQQTCANSGSSADGGVRGREADVDAAPPHTTSRKLPRDDELPVRLLDADELRQLRQLHGQRAGRIRRPRRADVDEPEHDQSGHRPHGPPVLGELRGRHARSLGPDRGAVHRRQTNPVAHIDDLKGVPFSPFTDKNGERHAVARLRADLLLAAG